MPEPKREIAPDGGPITRRLFKVEKTKTRQVRNKETGAVCLINVGDFDSEVHEDLTSAEEEKARKKSKKRVRLEDPPDSSNYGDQPREVLLTMTNEQLKGMQEFADFPDKHTCRTKEDIVSAIISVRMMAAASG